MSAKLIYNKSYRLSDYSACDYFGNAVALRVREFINIIAFACGQCNFRYPIICHYEITGFKLSLETVKLLKSLNLYVHISHACDVICITFIH